MRLREEEDDEEEEWGEGVTGGIMRRGLRNAGVRDWEANGSRQRMTTQAQRPMFAASVWLGEGVDWPGADTLALLMMRMLCSSRVRKVMSQHLHLDDPR